LTLQFLHTVGNTHCFLLQSLFNWADEFLGDDQEALANGAVSMDTGTLAQNVTTPVLFNTQHSYGPGTSIHTSVAPTIAGQGHSFTVVGGQTDGTSQQAQQIQG